MRITEGRMTTLAARGVSKSFSAFSKAAQAVSTNVAVDKPSDDPSAWASAARLRARANLSDAHREVVASSRDRLSVSDDALGSVTDALSRAREIAVQLASGTSQVDGRAEAAVEVRSLRAQVLAELDRRGNDGQPLFAGEGAQAFDAAGTYQGGGAVRQVAVGERRALPTGVLGSDLSSALEALDELATALEGNDVAGIAQAIDTVTQAHGRATDARQLLGLQINALDDAEASRVALVDRLSAEHDRMIGIDPVEAATAFARAQQQVEATRQVATSIHETLAR